MSAAGCIQHSPTLKNNGQILTAMSSPKCGTRNGSIHPRNKNSSATGA